MRSLQQEIQELQQENATLKRQIKQREKSQKELLRLLNLNTGERELLGKFADLSAVIPLDVLVLSLRWNESGVELQMQSSSEEINLAGAIRKLPYWKISQLQQRNWGDNSSSMITLKLIPAEGQK
jgi:Tfp pilus assembly protein PilN